MVKYQVGRHQMDIYHFKFGWIVQGCCVSGGGLTRNKAIDDWVENVTTRLSPGGFYTRHAKKVAKELKAVK